MKRKVVLVIEDDEAIRRGIVDALRFEGYEALEAGDGRRGLELAMTATYDLLLPDLVLPGGDGLDILQELRRARPTAPVIILTARGAERDRVRGLQLGADDYVVKPFSVKELLARIDAVLRRSPERPSDVKTVPLPAGEADLLRREVRFETGQRRDLSQREAELLRYLASNAGRAVSREEILRRVWGIEPTGVEQILFNLVDNACKYAGRATDRRIELTVQQRRRHAVLNVRDHGPGIAPREAGRLFKPFHKSARDAASSAPGVGLGLTLSRRLARRMGGDLRIDHKAAEGASFELTLPLA